jgi:hypothetical protein
MSGQHAAFSPSSAHRVVTCPASFLLSKDAPRTTNWFAVEGSIGHYMHEKVLKQDHVLASDFIGRPPRLFMQPDDLDPDEWAVIPADWVVDEAFAAHVQRSIDWCQQYTGEYFVETRVNISEYTPLTDQFGSCDFACIMQDGTLIIVDLKMGQGVKVYAERNHQLALYALGFMEHLGWLYHIRDVHICVSQPRLDHFDKWVTTAGKLRAFGYEMKGRFDLALKPDAPFCPDEKACKFCPVKGQCPALAQRTQELAHGMFDVLDAEIVKPAMKADWPFATPDAKLMTPEQTSSVLKHRDLIAGFLDSVADHATHLLLHGQEVPDFKLVEGRSSRVIRDVSGYETYLRDNEIEPFKPLELITLTAAESALKTKPKKAGLAAFTEKPRGRPTLAAVTDKRELWTGTAGDMFDAIES